VTIKYVVEKNMRAFIHPEIVVKNVPHGFEDRLDEIV